MSNSNHEPQFQWPEEMGAAWEEYPVQSLPIGFNDRVFDELALRRPQYRGWRGFFRRLWEIEIEGVAVWRLAGSMFSGSDACGLCFAIFAMPTATTSAVSPLPDSIPETPMMALGARHYYARELEELQRLNPAPVPKASTNPSKKGEVSCIYSSARLV